MGATTQSFANDETAPLAAPYATTATADLNGQTATNGESQASRGLSRFVYASSYALSYAVVFSALFVAYSLPQESPLMHGLRDGGRAAKDALKSKE